MNTSRNPGPSRREGANHDPHLREGANPTPTPKTPAPQGRPDGWTERQWRQHKLRQALEQWDTNTEVLYLDRAFVLANAVRDLLRVLDEEATP